MQIIPAIDLRGGSVVRLAQGDYQRETTFSDDPISVANSFRDAGASMLHIVDLDGARSGTPEHISTIEAIKRSTGLRIQAGGGLRNRRSIEYVLDAGAERVVLGTAAVEDPDLVEELVLEIGAERLVVGIDARNDQVAIAGWKEQTNITTLSLLKGMTSLGVFRFVYTDISRDGTMTSPNFAATQCLAEEASRGGSVVSASGGISQLDDLLTLATTGVEAAIVGSALYRGTLDLNEAILQLDPTS